MGGIDKILKPLGEVLGFRNPAGEGAKNAETRINRESELVRRRRVAIAASSRGRGSTLLGGAGGPQPAATRVTLLGNA